MYLTFRTKLQPTRAQYARLADLCERQRLLYNAALQERRAAWRRFKKPITRLDQQKSLTVIRSFDNDYRDLSVVMSRWTIYRVDDAFKGFFGRIRRGDKAGYPRFRAKDRWRSFGFAEWSGIRIEDKRLIFKPFVNGIRLKKGQPFPRGAEPKNCTFTRRGRHWFVSIVLNVPSAVAHPRPETAVGLDFGVRHLFTTSDGERIPNARPRSRRERDVRIAQRALARAKKGSRRRQKTRARLAKIQGSIGRVRADHLHKISARLAREFSFIAVEKLKLKNMIRSAKGTSTEPGTNVRPKAGLNRSLLDAAGGRLVELLSYKAERAGGIVIEVDPKRTSIACSDCGALVPKTLKERVHRCACGAEMDRDQNAARNILNRALEAHGRGRPPGDGNVGQEPVRRLGNTRRNAA